MARPGQRQSGGTRTAQRPNRRREVDNDGLIPVLARAVREVEAAAQRGQVKPSSRTKFQVIALLMRAERSRVRDDTTLTGATRAELLKRLDGIATILATTAVQDSGLLALLAEDADVSPAARSLRREMLRELGVEPEPEEVPPAPAAAAPAGTERRVVPKSVISGQLANPFLEPDLTHIRRKPERDRLAALYDDLYVALAEHLDAEEQRLLPIASHAVTQDEWEAMGAAARAGTPKGHSLTVFGMIAYDGGPEGVAKMMHGAPAPVRWLVPRLGARAYRKHAQRVYGTPTP